MTEADQDADGERVGDTAATAEADESPQPAAARRRRGPRLLWFAAAVVVLATAVAVAVVQTSRIGDLRADRDALDDARAARSVAGAFGEAYLTYDFEDVEGSGERILALATDDFARGFEETQAPGLEELFANIQTTTEATTKEVFIGDVDGDRARALVVVDVTASSTATGPQVLSNLAFVLDLTKESGSWLVDAVAPAPEPEITGPQGETPASSTTTAAP